MRRKIITQGRYVFRISFEILNLIKNNIVKVAKRKIPSALTIEVKETRMKETMIHFRSYFKKITRDDIPSKINNGSVMPNNELSIILGSNTNNAAPTKAIF